MDRDFIKRSVLVWLEMERMKLSIMHKAEFGLPSIQRGEMAESLTSHLVNNWEQIQRAKLPMSMGEKTFEAEAFIKKTSGPTVTRDTPEYYDRGE